MAKTGTNEALRTDRKGSNGYSPAVTVKTVTIGHEQPFCVIGERINPTGRKTFAEQLRDGDLSTVGVDVVAQVQAGADVLDVNAGVPLIDEPDLLKSMLRAVMEAVDVPICIDSSVVEALEAGLSVYEGRALVNSVTAEDDRMEVILPLVARHDAAVIGLANDETGIPETPEKRLECTRKIVSAAGDHGIAVADVVIDPLAMTVGADTEVVTTITADDQPDSRRARREYVPRRLERVLRASPSPQPQRGVPTHGDRRRADERDHVDRRGVRDSVAPRTC